MKERDFESIIVKYPEIIEDGLTLLGQQKELYGRRIDLLFKDKLSRKLIVELKIGTIRDPHIGQLIAYEGSLLSSDDPTLRIMLIGNRVPPNLGRALDHHGIAWKEISHSYLENFLIEKGDKVMLELLKDDMSLATIIPTSPLNPPQQPINGNKSIEENQETKMCRFSIGQLEKMSQIHEIFPTRGGRSKLMIDSFDRQSGEIIMKRSTGKLTYPPLKYDELQKIHNMIHEGKIKNDPSDIRLYCTFRWEDYICALLRYLGCGI